MDKAAAKVIGTVEMCNRVSEDAFDGAAILRIDVKSEYETETALSDICSLIVTPAFELFECSAVITKAPVYAVERISAVQKAGFTKAEHLLIGKDGYAYNGYWITEHK